MPQIKIKKNSFEHLCHIKISEISINITFNNVDEILYLDVNLYENKIVSFIHQSQFVLLKLASLKTKENHTFTNVNSMNNA